MPDGFIHAEIEQRFEMDGIALKIVKGNSVIFDSYSIGSEVRDRNIEENNISKLNTGRKFSAKFSVDFDASDVSVVLCPQTVKDYEAVHFEAALKASHKVKGIVLWRKHLNML